MLLSRTILASLILTACGVVWLPSSASAQGAYVRSGGYNSDCMIRPKFERPEFVKSFFAKSEFERPDFLKREIIREPIARLEIEKTIVLRPEFVRPEFHRCSTDEKSTPGGYRAAGYSTAPQFGQTGNTPVLTPAPAIRSLAAMTTDAGSVDSECCSGPLFTPAAAKALTR